MNALDQLKYNNNEFNNETQKFERPITLGTELEV